LIAVPPKIDRKQLRDVIISAGEMLKLEANIIGEPPAEVIWKKGQETSQNSHDKLVVITNVPYRTKLVINSAVRTDQVRS
jgi:hypothetical protein